MWRLGFRTGPGFVVRRPFMYNIFSHCLICGGLFHQSSGLNRPDQSSWRRYRDFDLGPGNESMHWTTRYRAICQFRPGERYRLSGLAARVVEPMGCVPLFIDKHATDGWSGREIEYEIPAPNSESVVETRVLTPGMDPDEAASWMPHGYIIHENCRLLLDKLFPEAESDLELLLKICRERYSESGLGLSNLEHLREGGSTYYFFNDYPLEKYHRQGAHLCDPLDIPAADSLIQRALHDTRREETKRKTRRWRRRDTSDDAVGRGSMTHRPDTQDLLGYGLPYDIILSVLDQVDNYADLQNVLAAFRWVMPETYWRQRLKTLASRNGTLLVFELTDALFDIKKNTGEPGDSSGTTQFRWKTLYLGTLRLMEEDPNMRNRARIFTLIDNIRDRFKRC